MERLVRRAAIGAFAGMVASALLIAALGHIPGVVLLGAVLGVGYAIRAGAKIDRITPRERRDAAE